MPPRPRRRKKLEEVVAKQKVRIDTRFNRWTRFFSIKQLSDAYAILEQASNSKMIDWKKVDPTIRYMERWIQFNDKWYAPAIAKYLQNSKRLVTQSDEDGMISFFEETAKRDAASRKATAQLIHVLKKRRAVESN